MKVKIIPSKVCGTVKAPPSKSMSHRMLICAGLSEGESFIKNISYSEDVLATLDCLEVMGAEVFRGSDFVKIKGTSVPESFCGEYFCRESGSTMRFFIPIAMLSGEESRFSGSVRLMERPMTVYETVAEQKGLYYKNNGTELCVKGKLTSGRFNIDAGVSSQFISGLLFALPLCDGDSEIFLEGKIESLSYIDMTLEAMKLFGICAYRDENKLIIKGGQSYKSTEITVEGDCSNAAFLEAFNLFGGDVNVTGIKADTLQGDAVYSEYFTMLKREKAVLDLRNCPDLAPVLMCLAAEHNGAVLNGTARLRIKESDRGAVMKQELSKFGADIEIYDDRIIINKTELRAPAEPLCSHNDHRVAMSLAVMCSKYGGEIYGAEAVNKSYPEFFEHTGKLGMEVQINDD